MTAIASNPETTKVLPGLVKAIESESNKAGNAPGNAFVLVRWTSLFIQQAAKDKAQWDTWGLKAVAALTNALNILLASNPKESTRDTALRVSRRAFRTLAKAPFGPDALTSCITNLSAKAATPVAAHALPLGIIAGVCSRLPDRKAVVDAKKAEYFAFYLREYLGSKIQLPVYIAEALHDFFAAYVTAEELKKEMIPAIEKSLLRAPEVVLNDLVAPVLMALPEELDLSEILASNLTKPLLANVKSTKPELREGALATFWAVAQRSHDAKFVENAADEILTPLKTGKVTAADQRAHHAQMLSNLTPNSALATKIPAGLVAVAIKEANEAAALAEIGCIAKYARFNLENEVKLDATIVDAFAKGLAEKRLPMRRVWALQLAELIWSISPVALNSESGAALLDASIGKLIDVYNEVQANPIPALQSGQIPVAAVATALSLARASDVPTLKNAGLVKKAAIGDKVLTLEPKPSFLLSPRIYTKLTAREDLLWLSRALFGASSSLISKGDSTVSTAWAQAVIYLLTSSNVPAEVRTEASKSLQILYIANAEAIVSIVINGLWQWCEDLETGSKDSAAIAAKTGREELQKVIRAICLAPETAALLETPVSKEVVEDQLRKLLVLCRPQLVPKASWIQTCLRTGTDPGQLVESSSSGFLEQILTVTEHPVWKSLPAFQLAASYAAADLAFVAPKVFTPIIVQQISSDLNPSQLSDVGPTEAAISTLR